MSTIKSIFDQLSATSSRLQKADILNTNKDNATLQQVFKFCLDPLVSFRIKKIPQYTSTPTETKTLQWGIAQLDALRFREKTGHAGIQHLTSVLSSLHPDDAWVIERIIEKDPRCGVMIATCNSVWGSSFILDFPVMKASAQTEATMANITYPALSQLKVDGARCQLVVDSGGVTVYSSNGHEMLVHGAFDYFATDVVPVGEGWVFDGELVVEDSSGNVLSRKKGNGIVNQAVKGTITPKAVEQFRFVVFDVIPLADWLVQRCSIPYSTRLQLLTEKFAPTFRQSATVVPTIRVHNEREAVAHFKALLASGLEGTIVKNLTGIWENKRSKDQVKMKGINDLEAQVVAVEPGTGKHDGKVGALVCVHHDIKFNVGSGLNDDDRSKPFEFYVGKIITVQYNEIITNDKGGKSLFLPRFVEVRFDKDSID